MRGGVGLGVRGVVMTWCRARQSHWFQVVKTVLDPDLLGLRVHFVEGRVIYNLFRASEFMRLHKARTQEMAVLVLRGELIVSGVNFGPGSQGPLF